MSGRHGFAAALTAVLTLTFLSLQLLAGLSPASAVTVTGMGYKAYQGGGGAVECIWTTGNMGNTYDEGEWVPYQVVYDDLEPGLAGLDSIVISFDFTRMSRFIDLVRCIQVGDTSLTDTQGWVGPDGNALPVTTREEIETAQNHLPENVWTGFAALNLPNEQVNRTLSGGADTPPGQDRHTFKIFKVDLLAAGVNPNASRVVIYFQLHEARTFVWNNQLEEGYDGHPADDWGGYLYGANGWPTADPIMGSQYIAGASGHISFETVPAGNDVPIPVPFGVLGSVSGSKWSDDDGDGTQDILESNLSGWRIHICGQLEGLDFVASDVTGALLGTYSFDDLSPGMSWFIKEDMNRFSPPQTGYGQSYPGIGTVHGLGTGVWVAPPPAGVAPFGWEVALTRDEPTESHLDFGNTPMAGLRVGPEGIDLGLAGENPAGQGVDISYCVPAPGRVRLAIWSVEGELVSELLDSEVAPGPHEISWNGLTDRGERAEPGVYYCQMRTGDGARNIKIVLAR